MHSSQGILTQSWYRKVSPTKDCIKERRQSAYGTVVTGEKGEEMERKNSSPRRTVITTWSYSLWSSLALQFREQTRHCSAGLSNSKKSRNVATHCRVARMQTQVLPGFKGKSVINVADVGVGNDPKEFSCKKGLCVVLFDGVFWVGHWNPSACIL